MEIIMTVMKAKIIFNSYVFFLFLIPPMGWAQTSLIVEERTILSSDFFQKYKRNNDFKLSGIVNFKIDTVYKGTEFEAKIFSFEINGNYFQVNADDSIKFFNCEKAICFYFSTSFDYWNILIFYPETKKWFQIEFQEKFEDQIVVQSFDENIIIHRNGHSLQNLPNYPIKVFNSIYLINAKSQEVGYIHYVDHYVLNGINEKTKYNRIYLAPQDSLSNDIRLVDHITGEGATINPFLFFSNTDLYPSEIQFVPEIDNYLIFIGRCENGLEK